MRPDRANIKSARLWGGLAVVGLSLALLAWAWHLRQPQQLVGHYQEELAAAPDDEVEPSLRQFAGLGDAGLNALVESLASDRAAVRRAAHRVLLEEVDRWELLSADTVGSRLAALANSLAEATPRMDLENRRFAADLALRLLLWPRTAESESRSWLTDCEAVLATAAERGRQSNGSSADAPPSKGPNDRSLSQPAISYLGMSLADKVQLPGGGLPLEVAPMPDVAGFVEPRIAQSAPPPSHEPRRLQVPGNTRSLDDDSDDDDDTDPPGGANHPGRLPSAVGNAGQTALGLQARRQSLGGSAAGDTSAWREMQPRDVMRRLHVSDPQVVLAAREELQRRGISGSLVELARRATDPDPKVRRQLAESLPSIPGVDAKPWLLELSYDENSQVRATAITLMATSGDLDLMRRLEQIAREDPDDHLRAQAAKVLTPMQR